MIFSKPIRIALFQVNHLGDFIAVLPLLRGLKNHPGVESVLLITSDTGRILMQDLDLTADVISFNVNDYLALSHRPFALWKTARRIRQWNPDLSMSMDDECAASALLSFCSGMPIRVGFNRVKNKASWMYNHVIPFDFDRHVIHNRWKCCHWLNQFTKQKVDLTPQPVPLRFSSASDSYALSLLKETGCSRFIAIHPYAKYAYKCWPKERYVALIDQLVAQYPDTAIFILTDKTHDIWHSESRVKVVPRTSLEQLIAILTRADLFIGNNSGPMNIAINQKTPTVCINGPSGEWWFDPWESQHTIMIEPVSACRTCDRWSTRRGVCVNSTFIECLKSISVARVYQAVTALLDPSASPSEASNHE